MALPLLLLLPLLARLGQTAAKVALKRVGYSFLSGGTNTLWNLVSSKLQSNKFEIKTKDFVIHSVSDLKRTKNNALEGYENQGGNYTKGIADSIREADIKHYAIKKEGFEGVIKAAESQSKEQKIEEKYEEKEEIFGEEKLKQGTGEKINDRVREVIAKDNEAMAQEERSVMTNSEQYTLPLYCLTAYELGFEAPDNDKTNTDNDKANKTLRRFLPIEMPRDPKKKQVGAKQDSMAKEARVVQSACQSFRKKWRKELNTSFLDKLIVILPDNYKEKIKKKFTEEIRDFEFASDPITQIIDRTNAFLMDLEDNYSPDNNDSNDYWLREIRRHINWLTTIQSKCAEKLNIAKDANKTTQVVITQENLDWIDGLKEKMEKLYRIGADDQYKIDLSGKFETLETNISFWKEKILETVALGIKCPAAENKHETYVTMKKALGSQANKQKLTSWEALLSLVFCDLLPNNKNSSVIYRFNSDQNSGAINELLNAENYLEDEAREMLEYLQKEGVGSTMNLGTFLALNCPTSSKMQPKFYEFFMKKSQKKGSNEIIYKIPERSGIAPFLGKGAFALDKKEGSNQEKSTRDIFLLVMDMISGLYRLELEREHLDSVKLDKRIGGELQIVYNKHAVQLFINGFSEVFNSVSEKAKNLNDGLKLLSNSVKEDLINSTENFGYSNISNLITAEESFQVAQTSKESVTKALSSIESIVADMDIKKLFNQWEINNQTTLLFNRAAVLSSHRVDLENFFYKNKESLVTKETIEEHKFYIEKCKEATKLNAKIFKLLEKTDSVEEAKEIAKKVEEEINKIGNFLTKELNFSKIKHMNKHSQQLKNPWSVSLKNVKSDVNPHGKEWDKGQNDLTFVKDSDFESVKKNDPYKTNWEVIVSFLYLFSVLSTAFLIYLWVLQGVTTVLFLKIIVVVLGGLLFIATPIILFITFKILFKKIASFMQLRQSSMEIAQKNKIYDDILKSFKKNNGISNKANAGNGQKEETLISKFRSILDSYLEAEGEIHLDHFKEFLERNYSDFIQNLRNHYKIKAKNEEIYKKLIIPALNLRFYSRVEDSLEKIFNPSYFFVNQKGDLVLLPYDNRDDQLSVKVRAWVVKIINNNDELKENADLRDPRLRVVVNYFKEKKLKIYFKDAYMMGYLNHSLKEKLLSLYEIKKNGYNFDKLRGNTIKLKPFLFGEYKSDDAKKIHQEFEKCFDDKSFLKNSKNEQIIKYGSYQYQAVRKAFYSYLFNCFKGSLANLEKHCQNEQILQNNKTFKTLSEEEKIILADSIIEVFDNNLPKDGALYFNFTVDYLLGELLQPNRFTHYFMNVQIDEIKDEEVSSIVDIIKNIISQNQQINRKQFTEHFKIEFKKAMEEGVFSDFKVKLKEKKINIQEKQDLFYALIKIRAGSIYDSYKRQERYKDQVNKIFDEDLLKTDLCLKSIRKAVSEEKISENSSPEDRIRFRIAKEILEEIKSDDKQNDQKIDLEEPKEDSQPLDDQSIDLEHYLIEKGLLDRSSSLDSSPSNRAFYFKAIIEKKQALYWHVKAHAALDMIFSGQFSGPKKAKPFFNALVVTHKRDVCSIEWFEEQLKDSKSDFYTYLIQFGVLSEDNLNFENQKKLLDYIEYNIKLVKNDENFYINRAVLDFCDILESCNLGLLEAPSDDNNEETKLGVDIQGAVNEVLLVIKTCRECYEDELSLPTLSKEFFENYLNNFKFEILRKRSFCSYFKKSGFNSNDLLYLSNKLGRHIITLLKKEKKKQQTNDHKAAGQFKQQQLGMEREETSFADCSKQGTVPYVNLKKKGATK